MGRNEDTDRLNRMTISSVGELLGLVLPNRGTTNCPFPDHDDRNPSFEVRHHGTRWVCYGCNRRGGAIDLVMAYQQVGFIEAKRWLLGLTKLNVTFVHTPKDYHPSKASSILTAGDEEETLPDHEVYEALLEMSPLETTGMTYLMQRGITKSTVSIFRIGQITDGKALARKLVGKFGINRLADSGLLTKNSTWRDARLIFPSGGLVFPFLEGGRVAYLQSRVTGHLVGQTKWRNLNQRKRRIYNLDALYSAAKQPIGICEGVLDTLSAVELGYSAIGLIGVNAPLTIDQIKLLRRRRVDILLDWDGAGEKRAAELQRDLRRYGVSSTRKNCPVSGIKDVNEYLAALRARK